MDRLHTYYNKENDLQVLTWAACFDTAKSSTSIDSRSSQAVRDPRVFIEKLCTKETRRVARDAGESVIKPATEEIPPLAIFYGIQGAIHTQTHTDI